jgi:hypothetical protein
MERFELRVVERAADGDKNADSERSRLKLAFENLADAEGFLVKTRLQDLAKDLGATDALSNSEIEEVWKQVQCCANSSPTSAGARVPQAGAISFEALWRWWVSDAEHESSGFL